MKFKIKRRGLQQGFLKLTKKTLASTLVISTVIVGTGLIYLFSPFSVKNTGASWFNEEWGYRKAITFTHNASVSTPSQVELDIDTTTAPDQFQSDCGDVRFTDAGGNLLRYYLDSGAGACDTSSTDFDVLMPTVINEGNLIYMYYGNPSAIDGTEAADFSDATTTPSGGAAAAGSEEKGSSPTLYWKLDDATVGTAQDSTANGLDGTHNNTPSIKTEDFCVSSKCLYFDGASNENVSKSDDPKLDFASSDNFTLQAWVKRSGVSSAVNYILTKAQAGYTGYKLYMDASGDFCFDVSDGTNTDTACTSGVDFDDDSWHFVTGVKAATTSITLYVDGVQRSQDASIAATGTLANTGTFYAGVDLDGTTNEWLGYIDELKVYRDNTARTASQIKADYTARGNPDASANLGANTQNLPGALSNGLLGYWKMDETSGNATDASGNGLTLTNNNTTSFAVGKFGNSGSFTAASSHYFSTATTISGVKTVSFWTNPSATTDEFINLISSTIYIISSSGTVSATGFSSPTIYVNGVLNGTITASAWNHVVITTDTGINASAFEVGRANSSYNNGKIDETRVYNRALSNNEVSQLYNFAPGPVGHWKMDEGSWANDCSTDSVFDSSGNGLNGDACPASTGPKGGAVGKFGKAGSFGGSDDYVLVPDNSALDITSSMTVETWVKFNSLAEQALLTKWGSTAGTRSWSLSTHWVNNDEFYMCVDDDGNTPCDYFEITSAANLTTGVWYHLAAVYNTTSIKLYVNGVQQATTTSGTIPSSIYSGSAGVSIGSFSGGGTNTDGFFDDAKIYNYARTQKQIVEDMNGGHPAPGSPVGSYVAYWKMDEGYSTTANDSSVNNNDLTLSNTNSWTSSGKFKKAWNGLGDRWMSRADDADLDFGATDDFTLSLWFKSDSATNPSSTEYILNKGPTSAAGYSVYANTSGHLCFGIDDDTTWGPDIASCTTDDFYDGTWHYLSAIRDHASFDKTYLYIDGILRDSDSDTTTATLENSSTFYAGDLDGTDNGSEFSGDLDEIKVYRSALTLDQVKIDMNAGASQVLGSLSSGSGNSDSSNAASQEYCVPGDSASCSKPVGRWDFEEGGSLVNNTTLYDSSTTGNHAIWRNNTSKFVKGKLGKAAYFDGSDAYALVNSTSSISDFTTLTAEAWIYPISAGELATGQIFNKRAGGNGWRLGFSTNNLDLDFLVEGSTNLNVTTVTNAVALNTWSHVAVSWNGSTTASEVKIYVNGKIVGHAADTNGVSLTGVDSANDLYLGNASGGGILNFDGYMDHMMLFNYARTPSQVAWDYNRGRPVAYWKMDECQGTSINDSSGNALTGTLTIGATGSEDTIGTCTTSSTAWGGPNNDGAGKRNYTVELDGTDDYIEVSDDAILDFDDTQDLTISGWFYRDTATSDDVIAAKRNSLDTSTDTGYVLYLDATNDNLVFEVSDGTDEYKLTSTSSFTSAGWYHFTVVWDQDSADNSEIYINGIDDNATDSGTIGNIGALANAVNLRIGSESDGASYFDGRIDELKIFPYALATPLVKNNYNDSAVRIGPASGIP